MSENLANLAETTLANAMGINDLSITVSSANFLTPEFRVIIDQEIILVTGVVDITWYIIRAQENTIAASHKAGAIITQVLTVQGLTNFITQTIEGYSGFSGGTSGYSGFSGYSGVGIENLDGGSPSSVYLMNQIIDGGIP